MSPHAHLIGTTVQHGNMRGPVVSVTATHIMVQARPGMVVPVEIPEALR